MTFYGNVCELAPSGASSQAKRGNIPAVTNCVCQVMNLKTIAILFFTFVIIPIISALPASADFTGLVLEVYDGDTLRVRTGGRYETVRLFGIDCPELKKKEGERTQPYGRKALEYARRLSLHKKVTIIEKDKSHGRIVGIVSLPGGKILNEQLLSAGLAWWYHLYCRDPEYAKLEARARIERKGLWKDPNPVPPWVFRHKESLEKEGSL